MAFNLTAAETALKQAPLAFVGAGASAHWQEWPDDLGPQAHSGARMVFWQDMASRVGLPRPFPTTKQALVAALLATRSVMRYSLANEQDRRISCKKTFLSLCLSTQ